MYSLIGDYYPKERRGSANAVLGLASGLGIAVGQLLAGMLGPGQAGGCRFYASRCRACC